MLDTYMLNVNVYISEMGKIIPIIKRARGDRVTLVDIQYIVFYTVYNKYFLYLNKRDNVRVK